MPKSSQRGDGRIGAPARKLPKLIANIPLESMNNTIGRQGVQRSPCAAPHSSMGLLDLNGSSVTHAITPQNYKKISRANGGKKNSPPSGSSSSYFKEPDDTQSPQSCNGKLAGRYHHPSHPDLASQYPPMLNQPAFQEAVAIPPLVNCPAGAPLPSLTQFGEGINPTQHNPVYQEPIPHLPQPVQEGVQYPNSDTFCDNSLVCGPSTVRLTADPLSFDWSGNNPSSQSHFNHGWQDPNSPPISYDFSSYDGYPMLSFSASHWSSFADRSTEKQPVYSQFLDVDPYNNLPQIQQLCYEDYGRFQGIHSFELPRD